MRRQVLVKSCIFIGNIILARLLLPSKFGIYGIVAFVVQCFSTFGDIGFGPALIQKRGNLLPEELSTAFWVQIILISGVVSVLWIFAPWVGAIYPSLPAHAPWLVRGLGISFLLLSCKSIPIILMERSLDFKNIAMIEILENVTFHGTAILLAYRGWEEWSFIIAAVSRGFASICMTYLISPWRPQLYFQLKLIRNLVAFGVPYQLNFAIGFLKDAVAPLFVGAYVGADAVGYLTWARTYAFAPLMLSESFGRIAFPAFSRIQTDRELLTRAIERSIRMLTFLMVPVTAMMMALARPMTLLLFKESWLPGLPAFYLYCTSPLVVGVFLPLYSAILSLGKSRVILHMTELLLVLEWVLGVPFVMKFGFVGLALNQPIIALIFFFVYKKALAMEGIFPNIISNARMVFLTSAVSAASVYWLEGIFTDNRYVVFPLFASGLFLTYSLIRVFSPDLIREFQDDIRKIFRKAPLAA
ncbi:MAG: oligosaccharide flippase family protein [Candidatus Riflebacteria bacterium]|nr:oligosaccharide flippase family protein [Candidatus Riflebacteria bacterium]